MGNLEHGGKSLAKIHAKSNDKKYFCYFTGFLEGIAASGALEEGEELPFVDQCEEFAQNLQDEDAIELLEDMKIQLLEHTSIVDAVNYRSESIDKACQKSSLNRFMGYCAGIACDDRILLGEAQGVVNFADANPALLDDAIAAAIVYSCQDALLDGEVDDVESANICNSITALVGDAYADTGISALGSVPAFPEGRLPDSLVHLELCNIVFTGNFQVIPRHLLEDEVSEFGAVISRSVSKKTDFVVVGHEAARDWSFTHKGNKLSKALSLLEQNGKPLLISESQLRRRLASEK